MVSSNTSPPTLSESEYTIPLSERIAISDVPPPISKTIAPDASSMAMPAPNAAAIGSSIR